MKTMDEIFEIISKDHDEDSWDENVKQITAINEYFRIKKLDYYLEIGREEDPTSPNYQKIYWQVKKN